MAIGRLYMQYFNNRDGTPKEEDKIWAKQMESFTVRENSDPIFFLDYSFTEKNNVRLDFFENGIILRLTDDDEREIKAYRIHQDGNIDELE